MEHDRDYFRKRAAEARAAAFSRDESEAGQIAGQLALAYAALARRKLNSADTAPGPVEEVEA